jgi:hypothetical protein
MKQFFLFAFGLFLWIGLLAQAPQAFKYQAVARDGAGKVLANQMVSFRISILSGSETGVVVFSETHTKSTNSFGLVDLEIGNGSKVTGSISAIDWSSNFYFLQVEMDPSGGNAYQLMGTSQLLSVPYALHAQTVEVDKVDDADNDPANEIQTLGLNGYELTLTNGGGSVILPKPEPGDKWGDQVVQTISPIIGNGTYENPLKVDNSEIKPDWNNISNIPAGFSDNIDNVDDADSDPTNELQTLKLFGNQLSLTPGGGAAVTLPSSSGGDNWGTQSALTDATLSGNGTIDFPLKIDQHGAISGQTLKWNGSTWLPGDDLTGTSIWTPSGSNIFFNTGKVGIGKDPGADLRKFQVLTTGEIAAAVTNNSTTYAALRAENLGSGIAASFLNAGGPVAAFYNNLIIQDGTQGFGKVLTSDASGNTSWQIPSSGPWTQSHSNIYCMGNVGIGIEVPTGILHVHGQGSLSGGSVLFEGSENVVTPVDPPASGSGTRMMWYPPKASFRVGTVTGTSWDKANIGLYSFATGFNTKASGYYSAAFGTASVASGLGAFVAGNYSYATGAYAVGMGINTFASGANSVAIGNNTTASGTNSVALCYETVASGTTSVAMGWQTNASGMYSTAMGYTSVASGMYSTAIGYHSTASGVGSFSIGLSTEATSHYSTAMGSNTTASGMYSLACGIETTAPSLSETVVGMYNTTYAGNASSLVSTNRIFVVGNGTGSSDRSNAMTILKNGNVGIGVDAPTYTLAVSGTAAKTGGGSWTNLSDVRLKNIHGEYKKGLGAIIALKPVMFTYKDGNPRQLPSDENQVGFIAQEVKPIFPEAVTEGNDGYLDFNMHTINVALVNAVKELKAENDKLKKSLNEVISRVANLETQISAFAEE